MFLGRGSLFQTHLLSSYYKNCQPHVCQRGGSDLASTSVQAETHKKCTIQHWEGWGVGGAAYPMVFSLSQCQGLASVRSASLGR